MIEITPLQIAADLTNKMIILSGNVVAKDTKTSLSYLLEMIELKRDFSRRVLRYLGYKRKIVYYYGSD